MLNLILGSTVISYTIKKSPRAKHVSVSIGADGVQVVAPVSMENNEIIQLVENKGEWIFNKLESYQQQLIQIRAEREFISGEKLLFRGENCSLKVQEYEGQFCRVNFTNNQFLIKINKDIPQTQRREVIRIKLEQWYICRAKELVHERLKLFMDNICVKVNTVRFKNQKTRWGSCSQKGNLNFNWKLVMAPMNIVDYVVVHELCHLRQMNHSKEFWMLVGSQIPDYKERRKWLKENGIKLRL